MKNTQHISDAIDRTKNILGWVDNALLNNPLDGYLKGIRKQYIDQIATMQRAVKFRIPKNGNIMVEMIGKKKIHRVVSDYLTVYQLPFPEITIEYDCNIYKDHEEFIQGNIEYKATIIIVTQTLREDKNPIFHIQILNYSRLVDDIKFTWNTLPYIVDLDLDKVGPTSRWEEFVNIRAVHNSIPTHDSYNDCCNEVSVVVQLIIALTCNNVEVKKGFPPSPSENKSRAKKGKAAHNQYYDIVINTKSGEVKPISKVGGQNQKSKETHLRRGHIRHYESKNVWIEATIVNAVKGVAVAKSYKVK